MAAPPLVGTISHSTRIVQAFRQEAQEFEVLLSPFWRLNEAGAILTGIPDGHDGALIEVHHPALLTAIRLVAEIVEREDWVVL